VLANATLIHVSTTEHKDLLWALKGAGNGQFGVVVSLKFKLNKVQGPVLYGVISWQHTQDTFVKLYDTVQKILPYGPNELSTEIKYYQNGNFIIDFLYLGDSKEQFIKIIQPILDVAKPASETILTGTFIEFVMHAAGCGHNATRCYERTHEPLKVKGDASKSKSTYFKTPLPIEKITQLQERIQGKNRPKFFFHSIGFLINPYGGEINNKKRTDTAFVHRDSLYVMQMWIDYDLKYKDQSIAWIREWYDELLPYRTEAYQNYCDGDLKDYMNDYFGENANRLRIIKKDYDPDNILNYEQSIR